MSLSMHAASVPAFVRQLGAMLVWLDKAQAHAEARKFDAFNRMSAFVVHDLKNIVSQLSLMMRNADRHGDKPEFRRDMNETIENALDKMRQLMTQLREGEPGAVGSGGVSLVLAASRIADPVAARAATAAECVVGRAIPRHRQAIAQRRSRDRRHLSAFA